MIIFFLVAFVTGWPSSLGAVVDSGKKDEIDQALELGEAIEQERAALSERDQAMLEAIVDEAIRQEELLRNRRTSGSPESSKQANDRFSTYDHGSPHDEYGPPPLPTSYKDKSFSLWSFKKMVFNALLQAVKAITGGVIALKGQIVKVKGHFVAAKGKLLETKGDAITEFGKHLATKALLTPVHVSNFDHNTPEITGPGSGPYPYPPALMPPLPAHPPIPFPGPPPPGGAQRPPYGRPPVWMGPPPRQQSGAGGMKEGPPPQSAPASTLPSPPDVFGSLQTWPLSPLQLQALANLHFLQPLAAPSSPPPVYGPPVIAPYPPSVSHSSYGSVMSHSSDYAGPPPTSYGAPHMSYGAPPSASHQYLPPPSSSYGAPPSASYGAPPSAGYGAPPSGFSSPSGPSGHYPPGYGSSDEGWNKRGSLETSRKKSDLADTIHAGLIVLKPIKAVESQPQHSVYRPPQAFSKSDNSRVDEDKTQLVYTNNKVSKT